MKKIKKLLKNLKMKKLDK